MIKINIIQIMIELVINFMIILENIVIMIHQNNYIQEDLMEIINKMKRILMMIVEVQLKAWVRILLRKIVSLIVLTIMLFILLKKEL